MISLLRAVILGWVVVVALPGTVFAQFDYVGDLMPVKGAVVNTTISDAVDFEVSVFDDGRTNQSATMRTPGIGAVLRWREFGSSDPFTQIPMDWDRKGGPFGPNNDIFTASIELTTLAGIDTVEWAAVAIDSTTGNTEQAASQDKNGNGPPFTFSFSGEILTDVDVTFLLCTNGIDSMLTKFDQGVRIPIDYGQDICVAGSVDQLDNFGSNAPVLTQDSGNSDLYRVTVNFPAGGPTTISYKYRVNGCDVYELEGLGNDRTFSLDYTVPQITLLLDVLDDTETEPGDTTCGEVPVEPTTWSGLKTRYGRE